MLLYMLHLPEKQKNNKNEFIAIIKTTQPNTPLPLHLKRPTLAHRFLIQKVKF